jgi:uncharacterized membrane protein
MEEFAVFFGRLHPLLVHLPIGFVIVALILDIYRNYQKNTSPLLNRIITFVYVLTFIFAIFTVITGLNLADEARFLPEDLRTHKWIGITGTLVLGLLIGARLFLRKISNKWLLINGILAFLGISLAGHYGGILTHGKNHLGEYAPTPLRAILGFDSITTITPHEIPDSVVIYRDFIEPQLKSKCLACHNENTYYGDFIFNNYSALLSKTKSGYGIIPGNSQNSEIFKRLILPSADKRFMPPTGEIFGYYDVKVIKYWIDQGADSLSTFKWETMDDELRVYLLEKYQLNFAPLPFYEKNTPDSVSSTLLKELNENQVIAKYLGEDNYYLDVKINTDSLTITHLNKLETVRNSIAFLDLSNTKISNQLLSKISQFPNISKLDLHGNRLADSTIASIAELNNLISINVYDTKINKDGAETLLKIPSLQRIYLWQTQVSDAQVNELKAEFPNKEIVTGFSFKTPPKNETKKQS